MVGFLRFGFDSVARVSGVTILKNRFYLPFGYTYDKYISFNDYKKLTYYKITEPSLKNIFIEIERQAGTEPAKVLINKLSALVGVRFADENAIDTELVKLLGQNETNKTKLLIRKHSVNNFENQLALLNAFVYEKESPSSLSLSGFKKISGNDSLLIVKPEKFNFEIYKNITDSLKVDTFQITEFSQANIKGEIELSRTKLLFFTIPFDKGWEIKVDGENKELSRVNIGFTGIVLPKGEHDIELYYIPQYSQLTSWVSIISIILFWLFLGYDVYRKRKF
ncbi:MAG: hypothetical protein B6I20_13870 [Bacteroidetes bacterium 4572_117]|nr:MAG: hypothetical protein B6I20_13870 [Bacteroidetes bacterium 4572_117]